MSTEQHNIPSHISENFDKALSIVDSLDKDFHKLAEQIINLLGIIDTPVGRHKLGIDVNKTDEESNIQTLILKDAKKTLCEMEEKGMLSKNFITKYSNWWRI